MVRILMKSSVDLGDNRDFENGKEYLVGDAVYKELMGSCEKLDNQGKPITEIKTILIETRDAP